MAVTRGKMEAPQNAEGAGVWQEIRVPFDGYYLIQYRPSAAGAYTKLQVCPPDGPGRTVTLYSTDPTFLDAAIAASTPWVPALVGIAGQIPAGGFLRWVQMLIPAGSVVQTTSSFLQVDYVGEGPISFGYGANV